MPEQEIGVPGGKPGPGRGSKTGSDSTRLARGETQAYLLRRLARDAPEVLERVKAGELLDNLGSGGIPSVGTLQEAAAER